MIKINTDYNSVELSSKVKGTLFADGKEIAFDDSNILEGSLSINNKCVNNDFNFGSVFVGEMNITLFNKEINRYSLYGAKISLDYYLNDEKIPLGVWFIDTPTRTKKFLQLKCYDAMSFFDISVDTDTFGTPYNLIKMICEKAEVELKNTEEELSQFPNSDVLLSIAQDRIDSYRDCLSYISSVMCSFCTINRYGKLEIRRFHSQKDMEIIKDKRLSTTLHDYETYYRGVVARFIADSNYYPYSEIDEETENGLILDLGDNPTVQGLEEFKHKILKNILAELKLFRYVPSEISIVPVPVFDLGDCLEIDGSLTIITSFSWTYRKSLNLQSQGKDTLLDRVSDRTSKQLKNLEGSLNSKSLVTKTYTNAEDFSVSSEEVAIIKMRWSAKEETNAFFMATIPFLLHNSGNVTFTQYKGLDKLQEITTTLSSGSQFATISNFIPSRVNENVSFKVTAKAESMATIEAEAIRATVFAQGLNTTAGWDGTLELSETFTNIPFDILKLSKVKDEVKVVDQNYRTNNCEENIVNISFDSFKINSINTEISTEVE